jgi:hypothetical protein
VDASRLLGVAVFENRFDGSDEVDAVEDDDEARWDMPKPG